jgi:hypothetical protein
MRKQTTANLYPKMDLKPTRATDDVDMLDMVVEGR